MDEGELLQMEGIKKCDFILNEETVKNGSEKISNCKKMKAKKNSRSFSQITFYIEK